MDHSEALRMHAAEKYFLGELSPEVRDQFEEHYFDCPECAADVRTLAAFKTASRQILEEEASGKFRSAERSAEKAGWFGWLRPMVAVPTIFVLAAVVLFQASVTIPRLKHQATTAPVAAIYQSSHRLRGSSRGEADLPRVLVGPNETFALYFDFTPSTVFPRYNGMLLDASGVPVLTVSVRGEEANQELHLVIPGGMVRTGEYELVFVGQVGSSNGGLETSEVQRLPFHVEMRP